MQYIVLDMEWNQPLNSKRRIKKPVVLYGEIIQIGAIKLDENFQVVDAFKITVAPRYYTKMNRFVSRLTSITADTLQYGLPFPTAFEHFSAWCGQDFSFLTWGSDDIDMLRDNMLLYGLSAEWIPRSYNLQAIFDDQITREKRQLSLSYAMEKVGETPLEAHDALNDARNTARLCLHMDMERGLAEYGALQKRAKCYGRYRECGESS